MTAVAGPAWAQTIRFRLAPTYSALLFGDHRGGPGRGLPGAVPDRRRRAARPGHREEVPQGGGRQIVYRAGEQFQAADLASVQQAVNFTDAADAARLLDHRAGGHVRAQPGGRLVGRRPGAAAGRRRSPRRRREITATDLSRRIAADRPAGRAAHAGRHHRRHARPARRRVPAPSGPWSTTSRTSCATRSPSSRPTSRPCWPTSTSTPDERREADRRRQPGHRAG